MSFSPDIYEKLGIFYLGRRSDAPTVPVLYDSRDLTTHAMCVGMTGSGKTGLCVGLVEEAAIDEIPVIVIDPKGDLSNLLLSFSDLDGEKLEDWVDQDEARRKGMSIQEFAASEAQNWQRGMEAWGQTLERIQRMRDHADFRIYTPGSTAGLPVSMLSSLDRPADAIVDEPDLLSDRVENTVSGLLGLMGIDADPLQSGEHVLLSNILAHVWASGDDLDLPTLIRMIQKPPFDKVGVMPLDDVFGPRERGGLAMRLNNLVAAPSFRSWLEGDPLDVDTFLYTPQGKPRVSIFSIAHLSEPERMFFVSLLLDAVVGWVRTKPGSSSLRALIYMDEIAGYLPPVAKPPSKKPIMTLLKQARAYGVGMVLATQNPADMDYKALSNCGTWFIGRLQTERDRKRLLDGLGEGNPSLDPAEASTDFDELLSSLQSRHFVLHNVHSDEPLVFQTRWVMSYLKGPMTRDDIRRVMQGVEAESVEARATEGTEERKKETIEGSAGRPIAPADVHEFFMPIRVVRPQAATLLWRPMIYGCGRTFFEDEKHDVAEHREFGFITDIDDGPIPVDWLESFRVDYPPRFFVDEPSEDGGHFLDCPSVALDEKSHDAWSDALVDHVYRNDRYLLQECKPLKLTARPGESERDFARRVRDATHELRDDALDELRAEYEKRTERFRIKISKLQDRLAREKADLRDAGLDTALEFGGSIFDAFTGRSARSAVRRSVSKASRASRQREDVDRAQEALADEHAELQDLERQFKEEMTRLAESYSAEHYEITQKKIDPLKRDIDLQLFGLCWVPYWQLADGQRQRAV